MNYICCGGGILVDDKFIVKHKSLDKKDDRSVTMTIRIDKVLQEKYNELALKSGRSRNELISMAMNFALDRLEFLDNK